MVKLGLRAYLYKDQDGIESLLRQIESENQVKTKITETKHTKIAATGGFGISGILKNLIKAETEISVEGSSGISNEYDIIDSIEDMIKRLESYLVKNENIILKPEHIPSSYKDSSSNFVRCSMIFNVDNYSNIDRFFQDADKYGYITFSIGDFDKNQTESKTYDSSDEYYKGFFHTCSYLHNTRIIMATSVKKLLWGGRTSHFALLLRSYDGVGLKLEVFGFIHKINKELYQIKPFAVWLH